MSCEHVRTSLDKKFEKHYFLYTQTQTHSLLYIQMIVLQLSFLTMEWEYTKQWKP